MKKFSIKADFGGQESDFVVYVGKPQQGHHPLQFQAKWLSDERGGTIPSAVMDAVDQIYKLAEKNGVSAEDLCVYALGTAQEAQTTNKDEEDNDENKEEIKTEQV